MHPVAGRLAATSSLTFIAAGSNLQCFSWKAWVRAHWRSASSGSLLRDPAAWSSGRGQLLPAPVLASGRRLTSQPDTRYRTAASRSTHPHNQQHPSRLDKPAAPPLKQSVVTLPRNGEHISSGSNAFVKHCTRLLNSSTYRAQTGTFLLVGEQLIGEAQGGGGGGPLPIRVLLQQEGWRGLPPSIAEAERVVTVTEAVMRKVTGLESAAGIRAVAEMQLPPTADFGVPDGLNVRRLLALDGVRDPGNMGTLLRNALAFGWDGAWLLPGCCDPLNDKALRAGRGAPLRLRIAGGPLQELLRVTEARGMLLLAADLEDGQEQAAPAAPGTEGTAGTGAPPVCLVLGSEGPGLSPDVRAACRPVSVPMASGQMESLNVAVAGSILMFALSDGLLQLSRRLSALQAPTPKANP